MVKAENNPSSMACEVEPGVHDPLIYHTEMETTATVIMLYIIQILTLTSV